MRHRPSVTVAMCRYNSSRFIDEALASVFAQTFHDYEVVLIDDGSTDGYTDVLEQRYRGRPFRVVRLAHHGLSLARRASIRQSSGELVAFLDSDDLWLPHKLERQVAAARAHPEAALFFSDCLYIDEHGAAVGRLASHYRLDTLDLAGTSAYAELLRRGCFVWQSTVLARKSALEAVDSFDPRFPYIADYDTWLRMARRFGLHYTPDVLAKWRVHDTQFTSRSPEITLADHRTLLGKLYGIASIPRPIRIEIGDRLLGQHRVSSRDLIRQGRFSLGVGAAAGMLSYPDRLLAFGLGALAESRVGPTLLRPYKALRRRWRCAASGPPPPTTSSALTADAPAHVWIDGSVLAMAQTGYFNLVAELIRSLVMRNREAVHVVTSTAGRRALEQRLGGDAAPVLFEDDRKRLGRRSPPPHTMEVVVWRGRFRWKRSTHVAIVQDLTTRIHPELHTPANVEEFERFLAYAHRHAHLIATVSENSRRDIVERLDFYPDSVSVIPMPLHPCYRNPVFDPKPLIALGVSAPYLLSVACIEPRKNLRRLVQAFEAVMDDEALRSHVLVLAGPQGWDPDFRECVSRSPACARIRTLGFVPQEHMPSLYHFASAVVCPSLYEGFGLPVLEAMSATAVVLASENSSLPEVLGDGITFDPSSVEAIATGIRRVAAMTALEDADYRKRCRARAEMLLTRWARTPPLPGLAPAISEECV